MHPSARLWASQKGPWTGTTTWLTGRRFIVLPWVCISWLFSLTNWWQCLTVLHPRHKLQYFKNAGWEEEWIDAAAKIVHNKYERSYSHLGHPNDETSAVENDVGSKVRLIHLFLLLAIIYTCIHRNRACLQTFLTASPLSQSQNVQNYETSSDSTWVLIRNSLTMSSRIGSRSAQLIHVSHVWLLITWRFQVMHFIIIHCQ